MSTIAASTTSHAVGCRIQFIPNPEFEALAIADILRMPEGKKLYADRPDEGIAEVTEIGDFERLQSLPMLSIDGERFLFRKMNFLKYQADVLQRSLDRQTASPQAINEIENNLADSAAVRNHLAECNLRLVISIARKFATNHAEFDELVSEGNMILLNAIDKFDFARGFRFSTYVTHSIQRHIYRWTKQKTRRVRMELRAPVELLSQTPADESDAVSDEDALAAEQHMRQIAIEFESCLDQREQLIVRRRFGLDSRGAISSLREVADEIGLSKERVRQLQATAVGKLRQLLRRGAPAECE